MRFLAAVGALCFLASTSLLHAQIQVTAQTERSQFLLYERVDVTISITNEGESDLVLDNNEGSPWLSFLVTKHNRLPVRPERNASFKALTLKSGESKTLRVNITPLFAFREEGDYKVEVVIDLPGQGQVISEPVPFSVLHGRQVWTATRPVDGTERVYSLLRFSPTPDKTDLYLRVEVPGDNLVLTNLSLGEVVAYVDPEVFFDPQGNIHIMQPIAMSTYLYSRANPDGKVEHQGIFKSFQEVPPRLTKLADGNVIVAGGLEEDPNNQRETLSEGQRKAGLVMKSAQATTSPDANMGNPSQADPPVGSPTPSANTPSSPPLLPLPSDAAPASAPVPPPDSTPAPAPTPAPVATPGAP
jgi:hypothetical protein